MRLKLTLFLVLLNVTLFGYIFYLETSHSRDATESSDRLILPSGTVSRAEQLALRGERVEEPWTLRSDGRQWHVVEPVEWPANPYAMRRLLDLLSFLQWETSFPVSSLGQAGKELADYGLAEGSAELEITGPNGTLQLRVGAPTEIGNRVYVLSPDQSEVYVVDRSLLEGMSLDADSLIDRDLIEIPTFEAESLHLSIGANNSARVQLSRTNGGWVLNAPIRAAADSHKVENALDRLQGVEVASFTDRASAATGLADPALRLNLNGNNRQQTILLGDVVDRDAYPVMRYAKLEARPAVFTVPAEPFEEWFTAQESLRERRFMDFSPVDAGALEVRFDDRSISLQKLESGRWQLVHSVDGDLTTRRADDALVQELLENLAALEAVRFVTDAPSSSDLERYGFSDPQRQVTIRLNNGETRTLLVGNFVPYDLDDTRQNRLYAKRDDASPVYMTTASILSDLPLNSLHYRHRVAGSLPGGADLNAVRVRDLETDETLFEVQRQPDAGWDETISAVANPDQAAATRALVTAFRRFPVDRFLADSFSDPLQLDAERTVPWRFVLEADVELPGGADDASETRRYYLTERLGGTTQYGGSPSRELTFRISQELVDALHPLLFDQPRPDAEIRSNPPASAPAESITVPFDEIDPIFDR